MPKSSKGKYILFSKAEYESIEETPEGDYKFSFSSAQQTLNETQVSELFEALCDGKSRPALMERYGLSKYSFESLCRQHYGTVKISDIRDKMKLKRMQTEFDARLNAVNKDKTVQPIPVTAL